MSNFPAALDDATILPSPGTTAPTNGPSHGTLHSNTSAAVLALEAKVGADGSAVTTSLDYKINHLAPANVGLGNVNNTSDANKPVSTAQAAAIAAAVAAGVTTALQAVYPVGSVYTSTSVNTNPASILGFGTWTAIQGEVLVGQVPGDPNFGTAGAAVGSATNTHQHPTMVSFDGNGLYITTTGSPVAGSTPGTRVLAPAGYAEVGETNHTSGNVRQDNTYDTTINIIQPSLTVYMWQRTA
jgi:hypothetical protein